MIRIVYAPESGRPPTQSRLLELCRVSRQSVRAQAARLDHLLAGGHDPSLRETPSSRAEMRAFDGAINTLIEHQYRAAANVGYHLPRPYTMRMSMSAADLQARVEAEMVRQITITTIAVEMVAATLRDQGRDVRSEYPPGWPPTAVAATIDGLARAWFPSEWVAAAFDEAAGFLRAA